jgi:hypothetical protein
MVQQLSLSRQSSVVGLRGDQGKPAATADDGQHRRARPGGDGQDSPSLGLPIEGARSVAAVLGSAATDHKPAPSAPPSITMDGAVGPSPKVLGTFDAVKQSIDEPEFVVGDPTEDDQAKAQKMFDGNEDFIARDKAASWMGEEGPVRQRTLRAYMSMYDFTSNSVLQALRQVCDRLVLRAETQQIDRILVAFASRWCDCNPNHGFKTIGTLAGLPVSVSVSVSGSFPASVSVC